MVKLTNAWKDLERAVADKIKGVRITRGMDFSKSALDVEHPRFAIDCKFRDKLTVWGWYEKLVADNKKLYPSDNKIPILVMKQRYKRGELVAILLDDFIAILKDEYISTDFKKCTKCGKEFPPTAEFFHKDKTGAYGLSSRCKTCANETARLWKEENRDRYREALRKSRWKTDYGLSKEDYESMLDEQDGVCAICGEEETRTINGTPTLLCVDHSHATGKVRGLLCHRCNSGLGYFKDNVELLKLALVYLDERKDDE